MKKVLVGIAVFISILVLIGYAWYRGQTPTGMVEQKTYDVMLATVLQHSVPEISVRQLHANPSHFTILDSRTLDEYHTSHIPGAIYVGEELSHMDSLQLKNIPTDKPIVVYCAIGLRSEKAAQTLTQKGFKNVYNLYGGAFEWSNEKIPLENDQGNKTDTIHGYSIMWVKWLTAGTVKL